MGYEAGKYMTDAVWIPTITAGSFNDANNWNAGNPTPGPAPGAGDTATIETAEDALEIQGNGDVATLDALGNNFFNASVIFDGADITATNADLGPYVTLDGGANITATDLLANTETLLIEGGANLVVTSNAGLDASVDINGGTLTIQNIGVLETGNTLIIDGDGAVIGPSGGAGFTTESNTAIDVYSGTLSSHAFYIAGSLTMEDGALDVNILTFAAGAGSTHSTMTGGELNTGTCVVGGTNNTTSLDVESGATVDASEVLGIGGAGGIGSIVVDDGGEVEAGDIVLGQYANGNGTLLIQGADALVHSNGTVEIGVNGDGSAQVMSGGALTSGDLEVGSSGAGFGDLDINQVSDVHANTITIGVQGAVTMLGGTLEGGPIDLSGKITGIGTLVTGTGSLTLDGGGLFAQFGTLEIDGDIVGSGVVTVQANSVLQLDAGVVAGQSIGFSGGEVVLEAPSQMLGSFAGFGAGDTIVATGIVANTPSFAGGVLSLLNGTSVVQTLNVTGAYDSSNFLLSPTGNGTAITYQAMCFAAGTLIRTPAGEVQVQKLRPGDRVITLNGEARRIIWVGSSRVMVTRGQRSAATPVIVRKGAFADNVPHHDLHVTKGHSFYLNDVLVPVEFLVNHRSILWNDWAQEITIYHIELESHDVLLANGAPAESYRDDGNRWLFFNDNPGWHLPPQSPCAPVHTGGPIVDAIWRHLLERSGPRKHVPLTNDPDLHLMVEGHRVDPTESSSHRYVFRLARRPRNVRIVSRSAIPQELGFARDARILGVALRQMVLVQGARRWTLNANAASLAAGFYDFESENGIRWTDGDAAVPPVLLEGIDDAAMLIVHLGGTTQYLDDGNIRRTA